MKRNNKLGILGLILEILGMIIMIIILIFGGLTYGWNVPIIEHTPITMIFIPWVMIIVGYIMFMGFGLFGKKNEIETNSLS